MTKGKDSLIPVERIEQAILLIRNQKVMLDGDLAALYRVETKALVRAVKRNVDRFPADFMFQLSPDEFDDLRCQFGTSSSWGGRRYPPYAFSEQGVAMLSSVLRSPRAVAVNIEIMRAFVRLRGMLASHADLTQRLDELEQKYDRQFAVVFDAIRQLMTPPQPQPQELGYHTLMEKK
jgi:ORF6N domain